MDDTSDQFKEGECEWCGAPGPVYIDNDRCQQCDQDIVHCSICDRDQHLDYKLCRHVFLDCEYNWSGAGCSADPEEHIKQSFGLLLSLMPSGFGLELLDAIRSGRFHTWMIAPLIGGGDILELRGTQNSDLWGEAIVDVGEGEHAEKCHDGYRWLVSLYNEDTAEANQTTLSWIQEFQDGASADRRGGGEQ